MTARRVLVILAHPNLEHSKINAEMIDAISDLPNVTVHDLHAQYPDFAIDVEREQQLIREHDVIVFQSPVHWYSVTPIMQQWFNVVLRGTFAYTFDGSPSEISGKVAFAAVSFGGDEAAYSPSGYNLYTAEEFLRPVERTAGLCQLDYREPFAFHGAMMNPSDEDIRLHAKQYRALLEDMSLGAEVR